MVYARSLNSSTRTSPAGSMLPPFEAEALMVKASSGSPSPNSPFKKWVM